MRNLIDTNILLRFAITTASQSEIVRLAIEKLEEDGQELLVTVQNLVAAVMLAHGVGRILTLNDQDFRRFEPTGIEAIHPRAILT